MRRRNRARTRSIFTAWMTLAWVSMVSAPVLADSPHGARAALSDDELGELRGGFLVADGIKLDFGAVVRTFVDGQLALETILAWTPEGPVSSQTTGEGVTPVAGALAADPVLTLAGLRGPLGLDTTNGGGDITALVQQVTNGAVQNMVLTTASGQTILQETNITLTLPGFDANQRSMADGLLGLRIADDGQTGAIGALAH